MKNKLLRSAMAFLLCAAMVLPLAGCGNKEETPVVMEPAQTEEVVQDWVGKENQLSADAVYQIMDQDGNAYGNYTFYAAKIDADDTADLTYIVENALVCRTVTDSAPQAIDLDAGVYAIAVVDNANHENREIRIIWVQKSGGADTLTIETDWEGKPDEPEQTGEPDKKDETADKPKEDTTQTEPTMDADEAKPILEDFLTSGAYRTHISDDVSTSNLEYVIFDVNKDGIPELLIHDTEQEPFFTTWLFTLQNETVVLTHESYGYGAYRHSQSQNAVLVSPETRPFEGTGAYPFYRLTGTEFTLAFTVVLDGETWYYIAGDAKKSISETEQKAYFADAAWFEWQAVPTADAEEPEEDVMAKPTAADGYIHSHPLDTTVCYDLNGDGKGEEITATVQEYSGTVTVNGVSVAIEPFVENPTGYFTIIHPDAAKDVLLIGVSQYGPSDDPMTSLYSYNGAEIRYVGAFDDIIGQHNWEHSTAVCHGDGTISANTRMDVLGTWGANALYAVDAEQVKDVTEFYSIAAHYNYEIGWEATTMCDIIMYADCDRNGTQTVVPTGTVLYMTGCQDVGDFAYWVAFESEAFEQTMWLYVVLGDGIYPSYVETPNGDAESTAVFDGFFYAG